MRRLLGLVLLAGCATSVPHATDADLPRARRIDPAADLATLEQGRSHFVQRCSGCHTLPEPTRISSDAWPPELDRMQAKSKLTPDERRTIEVYLRTIAPRD